MNALAVFKALYEQGIDMEAVSYIPVNHSNRPGVARHILKYSPEGLTARADGETGLIIAKFTQTFKAINFREITVESPKVKLRPRQRIILILKDPINDSVRHNQ